jgi:hypothetical protein
VTSARCVHQRRPGVSVAKVGITVSQKTTKSFDIMMLDKASNDLEGVVIFAPGNLLHCVSSWAAMLKVSGGRSAGSLVTLSRMNRQVLFPPAEARATVSSETPQSHQRVAGHFKCL